MGVAAVAAIAVGSAVVANAASSGSDTSTATTAAAAAGTTGGQGARRGPPQQTQLTGDTADKVKAAAEQKVPGGTVLRVEGNPDGTYHAHVRKSDGTEVVVQVNKDFEATDVQQFDGRGPGGGHGPGGPGGGPGAGETPLTGTTADKVTAAAKDKVPGGTVLRVETDSGPAAYEAHVRKSDGTEVVVLVNKDFGVTGVEQFGPSGQATP
jgi:hypothetical protein